MINVEFHDSPSGIDQQAYQNVIQKAEVSLQKLFQKDVEGSEWLGWLDVLVGNSSDVDISALKTTAKHLQSISDVVLCIGIGGSYLGTAATLAASSSPKDNHQYPEIRFLGTHLGGNELNEVMGSYRTKILMGQKKEYRL
jgi:glucose-6-phosphate isomerase